LAYHGGKWATGFISDSGFVPMAQTSGVLVAFLQADRAWENGTKTGLLGVSDFAFTDAVVAHIELVLGYTIDRTRVLGVGHSNGALMVLRAGHEMAGRFRAIAANSGSLGAYVTAGSPDHPLLVIHGTADAITPYMGGQMVDGGQVIGAEPTLARWSAGCSAMETAWPQVAGRPTIIEHATLPCSNVLLEVVGGAHQWPAWTGLDSAFIWSWLLSQ
jgi:poly(3-hydroxybutyrate) depolymerase